MGNDKQIQKAGDNSQQVQAKTVNIYNSYGITEERVKEICAESAVDTIKQCTTEATDTMLQRIEMFSAELIPRIEKVEKDFNSFSDPAFQVLLRKAQLVAACTEREEDYKILSELLLHRAKNKSNIKKKASITKAVEIIDQIDDDSLCGMTMFHAIKSFIPLSGNITEGVLALLQLYKKLNIENLPKDDLWIDNLSILGALSIVPISNSETFEELLSKRLDGYVCAGIKKDSPEYSKAIEKLTEHNVDINILVDNELLDGFVRLKIVQKSRIDDWFTIREDIINGKIETITEKITDEQINVINNIFSMYSKDNSLNTTAKNNFIELLHSYGALKSVSEWYNSIKRAIYLTSVGRVIAHTNAKSIDDKLPDLD